MKWVKHGLCHLLAHRTLELRPDYQNMEDFMYSIPERFAAGEGTVVYKGRNELRKMTYGGLDLVVKSFHRPNLVNRFVYGVFRPSKAKLDGGVQFVILMYAKDCFSTVVIM